LKIELVGRVFAGRGEGTEFLKLPWVGAQTEQKLGFKPYPGTLNLKLSQDSAKLRKLIAGNKRLKIYPSSGYCEGLLFKACIADLECGVVIPQVENYPNDVIEVISWLNLREKLQLRDGSQVTITVDF